MDRTPNYKCPKCNGELVSTDESDWQCSRCGVLIEERGGSLRVDVEPDRHGSRVETYNRNHAEGGMDHE